MLKSTLPPQLTSKRWLKPTPDNLWTGCGLGPTLFPFLFLARTSVVICCFLFDVYIEGWKIESQRSSVPVLLGTPFILQIQRQKWETSILSCWKFFTRSRRLAEKLPCLLHLLEAKPSWSLKLGPLQRLLLSPLQHHLGVTVVAAVREQGLAATSVQLHTRLPWQR